MLQVSLILLHTKAKKLGLSTCMHGAWWLLVGYLVPDHQCHHIVYP